MELEAPAGRKRFRAISVVVDLEAWESLRTRPPKAVMVAVVLKDMLLEMSNFN